MPRSRGDGKLRGKLWPHLRSHYDKNLSEESASPDNVGCKVELLLGSVVTRLSAAPLLTRIDKISYRKLPVSELTL